MIKNRKEKSYKLLGQKQGRRNGGLLKVIGDLPTGFSVLHNNKARWPCQYTNSLLKSPQVKRTARSRLKSDPQAQQNLNCGSWDKHCPSAPKTFRPAGHKVTWNRNQSVPNPRAPRARSFAAITFWGGVEGHTLLLLPVFTMVWLHSCPLDISGLSFPTMFLPGC